MYISITGLQLRSSFQYLRFWYHAIPVMKQVRQAGGNVFADARTINGVHHTLTAWENELAMKRFLYQGAHRKAIKAFPTMATGKTLGFQAETIPPWADVPEIWNTRGRDYSIKEARSI